MIPAEVELLEGEEFRPVTGWESYLVSNRGRVYSLPKGNWHGGFMSLHQTKRTEGGGYWVTLLRDRQRRKTVKVHRLVAVAFIAGPRKEGIIRHLNGNGLDNRVENLAWGTASENALDKVQHGTHHSANKTHCPAGHPYDIANTTYLNSGRVRKCRTCLRLRARIRRARLGWQPVLDPTVREIRKWAAAEGVECGRKGPIPRALREAYEAATEQQAS